MAGTGTELLGFSDAQRYLGVSRSTLLRWLESGKVKGYKAGKKWKFRPEELERALVPATPGEEPELGALREPGAEYAARAATDQSVLKELRKDGFLPDTVKGGALDEGLWTGWQDAEQWLWLACVTSTDGARLEKRLPSAGRPASATLTPAAATAVLAAWQDLRQADGGAARMVTLDRLPGRGCEITVLHLPAHIDVLPAWSRLCHDQALDETFAAAVAAGHGDWLVTGPAGRGPAGVAFALAQRLSVQLGGNVTVVTDEDEPTYYWPGALQRYGLEAQGETSGATLQVCSLTYDAAIASRTPSTPAFRVAYCITVGAALPECPGAFHVRMAVEKQQSSCRLEVSGDEK
jgi:excisionase family DNA binding protein